MSIWVKGNMNKKDYLYEFFISYSRHNSEFAREIAEKFYLYGIPVWFAEKEILIEGRKRLADEQILKEELNEAAAQSKRCLFLISKESEESKWVKDIEIPPFIKRENIEQTQIIFPVWIGPKDITLGKEAQKKLISKDMLLCESLDDISTVIKQIILKAGLNLEMQGEQIPQVSSYKLPSYFEVTTEHRKFVIYLEIGNEWIRQNVIGKGMIFNLNNSDTDVTLNLIIGSMPDEFVIKRSAEDVEERNYFAESFLKGKIDFLKNFTDMKHIPDFLDRIKNIDIKTIFKTKSMIQVTGAKEVLGSHLINVDGAPHFAYSYRMRPLLGPKMVCRKYSIILKPPGSKRFFEFVFTAGYKGTYKQFLKRIRRVEDIVHSFNFPDENEIKAHDYYKKGFQDYNNRDFEKAINNFTSALKCNPSLSSVYYQRGLSFRHMGNYEKALQDFKDSAKLENSAEMKGFAHLNCGVVYEKLEKYNEALNHYDQAVQINPTCYQAWCNRGNMLMNFNNFEKALESYTKACELNPRDFNTLYSRANCYLALERVQEACKDFRNFLMVAPQNHPGIGRAHEVLSLLGH